MSAAVETPRREEIAAASAALFRRQGYPQTSIRDLAAALEIKSSSLYYHFENKEEILFAIAHGLMLDFVEQVTAPLLSGDDPGAQVAAMVEAHLRFDLANLDRVLVSAHERHSLPEDRQRTVNALRARHRRALETVLTAGAERGVFTLADPRVAASGLLDLLSGVKEWYRPRRDGSVEQLVATYQGYAAGMLGASR